MAALRCIAGKGGGIDLFAIFRCFRIVAIAFDSLDAVAHWWGHYNAHAE